MISIVDHMLFGVAVGSLMAIGIIHIPKISASLDKISTEIRTLRYELRYERENANRK